METISDFGQRIIEHLTADKNVDWFVDTNVLQSGWVERHFKSLANVFTTAEVIRELVKHNDKAKSGRRIASQLTELGHVASKEWHKTKPESFDLLMDSATQLAPSIRVRTIQIMESQSVPQELAEEKAIAQLAHEGNFFTSRLTKLIDELSEFDEQIQRIDRSTKRSWQKHPAKRRAKKRKVIFFRPTKDWLDLLLQICSLTRERRAFFRTILTLLPFLSSSLTTYFGL